MDGDTLFTIGDLARRTGLTVKAIRFYSDTGIVPQTDRTPAGYRLYDIGALARLDLVCTLRDLGLDLAVIRQVLDREVAAAHADALEVQIRTLRLRRAVLRAVAKRGSAPKEMDLMHKLALVAIAYALPAQRNLRGQPHRVAVCAAQVNDGSAAIRTRPGHRCSGATLPQRLPRAWLPTAPRCIHRAGDQDP